MALPTSRQESHGPQGPVKGTTIDALQDQHVGRKFNAAFPDCFGPFGETLTGAWAWNVAGTVYIVSTGASTRLMMIPCSKSARITGVLVNAFGDGAVDCTWTVFYASSAQALTNLCTGADLNRAAAWGTLDLSSLGAFTTRVMLEHEALYLKAETTGSNYRIGNIKPIFDRL